MIPLHVVCDWLAGRTAGLASETVPLDQALGRRLATPVIATALPARPSAVIDGLAVRAADTDGASEYAPLAVRGSPILAGDPLPQGADAVLPPHLLDPGPAALAAVAPGHGVVPSGHDAPDGWVLPAGCILRPFHVALLAGLGHAGIEAIRRPRVEVRIADPKQGFDTLGPLLRALLRPLASIAEPPDLVLLAGRSGPGPDDGAIAAFTMIEAHGLAIRPGETSAIGLIGGAVAILLPGAPLACAVTFALLAAPVLRRMGGVPEPGPIAATLARKITSSLGQIDAILVRCLDGHATPLAPAEHGSLHRALDADGLVLVPEGSEGYAAGATVQVRPL